MNSDTLLAAFLQHQGYALFESTGGGTFRPLGEPAAFSEEIFGMEGTAAQAVRLADRMPFLDDFLMEAEAFWDSNTHGQIDSGAWVVTGTDGREIALEASALWLDGKRVLCIRNAQARYDEQVEVLQRARDGLLAHDRLLREVQKKEILLHCIVHDLSQPLTAMRGCFSVMALGHIPPQLEELVQIGQRQAEKQESMIREILQAFSGELAAQQTFHRDAGRAPDLAQCARTVARDFSAAFAERGARIEVDPQLDPSRDWRVVGDESRLHRILSNLVENALRYAPAGSAVILRVEDEGAFLRACVDDQGPGLPQGETAPRLFALFSKGKDRGGKAGLGLYFCRITVERWGGTIGCESRPEGGSRFWFRLPRAGTAPAAGPEPSAATPAAGTQAPTVHDRPESTPETPQSPEARRPLRILLAEDVGLNRRLVTDLLEHRGHTVRGVENGREALAALDQEIFDLILMDIEMPELDGIEATRAIRQRERETGGHIPILAMTGHMAEREQDRFLDARMDGCVAKSAAPDDLYRAVEGTAQSVRQGPAAASDAPATVVQKVIDVTGLLARVGHDRTLLGSLVAVFLADAPRMLAQVREAMGQRNAIAAQRAADAMKASLENYGAQAAAESARRLEQLAREGEMARAAETLPLLEQQVNEAARALAALVSQQ